MQHTDFMRISITCSAFEDMLIRALMSYINSSSCDCIALSAGIDTSLIAIIAKLSGLKIRGLYTFFKDGIPRDLVYVNYLSKVLNIPVTFIPIDLEYVKNVLKDVYSCIDGKAYHELCIELRNDVVFYTTLMKAKEFGCKCIYTGSGGDELFAGYSFMLWLHENEIEVYREKWGISGRYPELEIANCLDIKAVAPYLSKKVQEIALQIPAKCLRGECFEGKRILRNIINKFGYEFVGERIKAPAEAGAGTDSICITP